MKSRALEQIVERKLMGFAEHHPEVVAMHKGVDEEGNLTYYLLTKRCDFRLAEHITRQDIKILRKTGLDCNLSQWPAGSSEYCGEQIYSRVA